MWMCEACQKQSAKPRGFRAAGLAPIQSDGKMGDLTGDIWVLCQSCATKIEETLESAVLDLGMEKANKQRGRGISFYG